MRKEKKCYKSEWPNKRISLKSKQGRKEGRNGKGKTFKTEWLNKRVNLKKRKNKRKGNKEGKKKKRKEK